MIAGTRSDNCHFWKTMSEIVACTYSEDSNAERSDIACCALFIFLFKKNVDLQKKNVLREDYILENLLYPGWLCEKQTTEGSCCLFESAIGSLWVPRCCHGNSSYLLLPATVVFVILRHSALTVKYSTGHCFSSFSLDVMFACFSSASLWTEWKRSNKSRTHRIIRSRGMSRCGLSRFANVA